MCIMVLRAVGVDHLEILAVLRGEVLLEDGQADHRPALVAQVVADVREIDQPVGRFQNRARCIS